MENYEGSSGVLERKTEDVIGTWYKGAPKTEDMLDYMVLASGKPEGSKISYDHAFMTRYEAERRGLKIEAYADIEEPSWITRELY